MNEPTPFTPNLDPIGDNVVGYIEGCAIRCGDIPSTTPTSPADGC